MRKVGLILRAGVSIVGLCASGSTFAQDVTQTAAEQVEIDEIVVTAQGRQSTLQRTAASIAALNGDDINQQGSVQLADILDSVVGVVVQSQAKGFTPAIRGLGTDLPPGSAEGAVAVNFDGAYNIRSEGGAAGFFDIGRIEVLRGPQGTLYGRNATAGVVNVISNQPELMELGGNLTLEAGNYGLFRGQASVNIPVGDTVAIRIAGQGVDRDGYLSNGLDDNVSQGIRIQALFEPSSAVSALIGAEYLHLGGSGASGVPSYPNDEAPADPWFTPNIVPTNFFGDIDSRNTYRDYEQQKIWARIDLDLGFASLSLAPSYITAEEDEAGCFISNCTLEAGDPQDLHQFAGEVRLASNAGAPVEWSVGYYHYDYDQVTFTRALNPAPETNTTSLDASTDAFFAQLTVPVGGALRLTGGARYTWDTKEKTVVTNFPGSGTGAETWEHFDWKLAAEYDVAANSMIYASVSTGFRPGGFNPDFSIFRPEELVSFEIGSKNRFLDGDLQINGSIFYYDYTDYQAFDFVFVPAPQFVFYNTSIDNYGAELEARAEIGGNGLLSASAAYLFTEFTDPLSIGGVTLEGLSIPHAPRWTLDGTYEHRFTLGENAELSLGGHLRYTSGQYVGPNQVVDAFQPSVVTGDLFATLSAPDSGYSLTAYVKNVGNTPIKTNYISFYNTLGAPRTYGLVLSTSF